MKYAYTNRFGITYYLFQETTRQGKLKLHFAKKQRSRGIERMDGPASLPEGQEVFETSRGQVFLRKKGAALIRPEEMQVATSALKKLGLSKKFEPWIDKNTLTIYEIAGLSEDLADVWGSFVSKARLEEIAMKSGSRQAVMRFVLEDRESRAFAPERFCFRGSVDDWIPIGPSGALEALCKKYFVHLGKDSIYNLY